VFCNWLLFSAIHVSISCECTIFLRSRLRDQWHHARATATQHVKGTQAKNHRENIKGAVSTSDLIVDNELSFRALEATWERNNIPCGFDVKSLDILFPEEMNAYQRWKKVRILRALLLMLPLPNLY